MKAVRLMVLAFASMIIPLTYAGGRDIPAQIHFTIHPSSAAVFNRINVGGYVNVVIKRGRLGHKPAVTITTYRSEPVQARFVNHTIYLKTLERSVPQLNKRPVVTVRINNLKRLTVTGAANVTAANMHSHGLDIDASGSGIIRLLGVLDVDHIKQSGSNDIKMRWVKSNTIYINSNGAGSIRLAGTAKTLYARIFGHATLHAAYLRTHYVQVQTKNKATAYVCPTYTLRAFATDFANIYYYKYPKNMTRDTAQSGNVLQMAWHN